MIIDGPSNSCRLRTRIQNVDPHVQTKPLAYILSGIPTSGKTTWIKEKKLFPFQVICRDEIRLEYLGPDYKQNSADERDITGIFNARMKTAIDNKSNVVIDQTNVKESYIDHLVKEFREGGYSIKIIFFEISLRQAYWRNFKRYLITGKYIPIKVIKAMKENFDKLNKAKYTLYL